jgi:hypothetical protein
MGWHRDSSGKSACLARVRPSVQIPVTHTHTHTHTKYKNKTDCSHKTFGENLLLLSCPSRKEEDPKSPCLLALDDLLSISIPSSLTSCAEPRR